MLTLIGLLPIFILTVTVVLCDTALKEALPLWSYFLVALAIFFYQTLDAVDGKQARRTGSSSPLGQLFDHGCDAITTMLISLLLMQGLMVGAEPNF